jgi:hypothetical protein
LVTPTVPNSETELAATLPEYIFRLTIEWPGASPRPVANVFYLESAELHPTDQTAANNWAKAVGDSFSPIYENLLAGSLGNPNFVLADVGLHGTLTGTNTGTTANWDFSNGSEIQSQVAALINWQEDAARYRGAKPRQYIGQLGSEAVTSDSQIEPSRVTGFHTSVTALMTGLGTIGLGDGGPWTFVCAHLKGKLAGNFYSILGGSLNPTLATQRRRLRKVARHRTP